MCASRPISTFSLAHGRPSDIRDAAVLLMVGDSLHDHISPAGAIAALTRPASISSAKEWKRRTSTPTRAPRQPRGDDARHLRHIRIKNQMWRPRRAAYP